MQSVLEKKAKTPSQTNGTPFAWTKTYPLLAIAAFWLICLAFIGVHGNFPLNDDWIYGESVQHLLTTGQLRLLACAPACIVHVIFAAFVCKIFGFSYTVLRAVGFFWAVLASFALYGSCRELRLKPAAALLLTLCFAANPLFLCLAFSFMTDTPAIALTLLYAYFLLQGLSKQKESSLILAGVSLVAATLVRQNLGFLAIVNAALLLCYWLRKKHSWALLVGLVLAPLAVGYLADKWMLSTNDFTSLYVWYKGMVGKQISQLLHTPGKIMPSLLQIAGELLVYLGLFALPALACFLPFFGKLFRNKATINPLFPVSSIAIVVYSLCRFIIGENRWMPFGQNLLRLPELGAHTILGINQAALTNKWRANLTWVSGVAGFMLGTLLMDTVAKTCLNLWRTMRCQELSPRRFGAALCALAAVLLFLFQFTFNVLQSSFSDIDRYYLFPFLAATMCLALAWRWHRVRLTALLAVPLLIVIASYSLAATHDMMAWNRARWTAIERLEAQGVNFKQIDGGAEYNYARDPQLFKNLILHETWYEFTHRGDKPRNDWRWWTVAGEDYIIAFNSVPDYEQVSKESYWSALSGKREIFVLHHVPPTANP